jgi:hypothetical protein
MSILKPMDVQVRGGRQEGPLLQRLDRRSAPAKPPLRPRPPKRMLQVTDGMTH